MRYVIAVGLMVVAGPAWAQNSRNLPSYPVDQICTKLGKGSAPVSTACVNSEQSAYDMLKYGGYQSNGLVFSWDELPVEYQDFCISLLTNEMTNPNYPLYYPYTRLRACVISNMAIYRSKHPSPVPEFQK